MRERKGVVCAVEMRIKMGGIDGFNGGFVSFLLSSPLNSHEISSLQPTLRLLLPGESRGE